MKRTIARCILWKYWFHVGFAIFFLLSCAGVLWKLNVTQGFTSWHELAYAFVILLTMIFGFGIYIVGLLIILSDGAKPLQKWAHKVLENE